MKNKKVWIAVIVIVALLGIGYFFRADILGLINPLSGTATNDQGTGDWPDPASLTTTSIRPASDTAQVSAAGNIEVASQRPVVLQVDGIVTEVRVEVGDEVAIDDLLAALDSTDLERAVAQAELNLASSQAQLDELLEPADATEVASARASLASAQESLAEVQAGPSKAELAAAQAELTAAQARYQELLDGPSDAELTQLSASLEKTMIDLQQAQWAYDQVSYKGDVGASSQAATLQQATIDYQAAKADYEVAIEPASQAELQDALSAIESAQDQLDTLRASPTQAELAAAQAQVASAQAQLDELLDDPGDAELKAAQISVDKARLELEEAQADLAQAQLRAPMAGTALSVDIEVGQQANAGLNAVTLADLTALELTVNVAEVDVSKVQPGQGAEITIDALPDKVFGGGVIRIAPSSESESGVVNYPVTIQLTGSDLAGVRPGMTAVATILDDKDSSAGSCRPMQCASARGIRWFLSCVTGNPAPSASPPRGLKASGRLFSHPSYRQAMKWSAA